MIHRGFLPLLSSIFLSLVELFLMLSNHEWKQQENVFKIKIAEGGTNFKSLRNLEEFILC